MLRFTCLIAIAISIALTSTTGCTHAMTDEFFAPTFGDAKRFTEQLTKQQQVHDDNMTAQHQAMSPQAAAAIDKLKAEFDLQFAELNKQTDSMHNAVGENIARLTQLAARFIGIPDGLPLTKLFDSTTSAVALVDTHVKDDLDKLNLAMTRRADQQADELQNVRSDNKLADKFTSDNIMTLKAAIQESNDKIQAVLTDPNKLRSTVLTVAREAGITPEAIATLESASDQDFIELLLTLLGGGLLGGAASRLGPSRSQKETDMLRQKVDNINAASTSQ